MSTNNYYSDDVNAQAISDNTQNPDNLNIKDEIPVTSQDMEIGDLDKDEMIDNNDSEQSYDEELVAGSDN